MSGAKHGSAEKGASAKPAEAYQPSMKGGSTGDVDLDTDNKLGKLRLSSCTLPLLASALLLLLVLLYL